ncbi:MAG: transcriptional repressor LexA [Chloroflexota bacterium]
MESSAQVSEEFEAGQDSSSSFPRRTETPATGAGRTGGKRKMSQLSKLQKSILEFIEGFIEEHNGLPPTVREIQEKLNISSTSVVDYNLKALEEKGQISRNKKQSRGVVLLNRPKTTRSESIPLLGVIAAGQPIPDRADVTTDDTVDVPPYMLSSRPGPDVFALRVKGQSMIDALIADGDIVLIKQQATAEIGETVAVWLESEEQTTLKKWYPEPSQNRVRLQPANITMDPIYTELSNVRVMGKLVGVIRTLA